MYSPKVQKTGKNKQKVEITSVLRYVALQYPNSQLSNQKSADSLRNQITGLIWLRYHGHLDGFWV